MDTNLGISLLQHVMKKQENNTIDLRDKYGSIIKFGIYNVNYLINKSRSSFRCDVEFPIDKPHTDDNNEDNSICSYRLSIYDIEGFVQETSTASIIYDSTFKVKECTNYHMVGIETVLYNLLSKVKDPNKHDKILEMNIDNTNKIVIQVLLKLIKIYDTWVNFCLHSLCHVLDYTEESEPEIHNFDIISCPDDKKIYEDLTELKELIMDYKRMDYITYNPVGIVSFDFKAGEGRYTKLIRFAYENNALIVTPSKEVENAINILSSDIGLIVKTTVFLRVDNLLNHEILSKYSGNVVISDIDKFSFPIEDNGKIKGLDKLSFTIIATSKQLPAELEV